MPRVTLSLSKGRHPWTILSFGCALFACSLLPSNASAEWTPPGIQPTRASRADIVAANAKAEGKPAARFARRREHWTYLNGSHRLAVDVAVRDDDFRATIALSDVSYTAGRRSGARWRGDGNGIVHEVQSDLQGDALDRLPQSILPFSSHDLTLVGETSGAAPAWVLKNDPAGDKPHWFYVDKKTGLIVRDVTRDGKRVITTTFDGFEPIDGTLRPRHWHISDGAVANDLDVTVDSIEPGSMSEADVQFPARRVFAPIAPLHGAVELPARFDGEMIRVDADIDGKPGRFILDTGTASVTLSDSVARRFGGATLEHTTVPRITVGPLQLANASTLTLPLSGLNASGILGLDFFFGHVIRIDYQHRRVEVLSHEDADPIFTAPKTTVVDANVDQGLPLVHAALGAAQGDFFAIDTGSDHLYVFRPFARRNAGEISAHWTPLDGQTAMVYYLEGGVAVRSYRVANLSLGSAVARDLTVGVQQNDATDLSIPFDGIIGTDILQNFDIYFDYDNGRMGLRR